MKSSKLCLCRIGSDAAKDELEGQRSCRAGQFDDQLGRNARNAVNGGVGGVV
jgi:hypothetical protein